MKRRPLFLFSTPLALVAVSFLLSVSVSHADILYSHQGLSDPTSEGFTEVSVGLSDAGPLANDLGFNSWRITGAGLDSQLGYTIGLTASDVSQIANNGFVLSMNARVIQNFAPFHQANSPVAIAGANVSFNNTRFEMSLGINSDGNTVVVLPTGIDAGGPGGSINAPGPFWTLPGNDYHLYELRFDPNSTTADFFIDGNLTSSGYGGHTSFASVDRFAFAAYSGGQGNFNSVAISAVPEPSTMGLFLVGLPVLALRRRRTMP